jgi:hypothetical protein
VKREIRRRVIAELKSRGAEVFTAAVRALILASLHDKQREIIAALAAGVRYIALCCSRRSGKTNLLAKLIVLTLLDAGFNQAVFYVAPTLKIGKGLIWAEVVKLVEDYQLGWTLRENTGEIITPAGARFFILGLNKRGQVDATRGFDALLFLTDETQEYEYLLGPTLSAVGPALSGRKGAFIASGTPGYTEQGTWYDWCHGKDGFTRFGWTVLQNPKNPRPGQEVIDEEKTRRGWDDQHPELLREWYGLWVPDHRRLLVEYSDAKNSIVALPENYGPHWRKVIGIDCGYDDPFAWVVVAYNPFGPERIVLHAEAHPKLIGDQACEITARLVRDFETTHVVADYAGGGKTFYETFNAKYGKELGCSIGPARKMDKRGRIMFLNTELRTGRMKLLRPAADGLVAEYKVLQKDEHGEVITSETIRDDLFDASSYALAEIAPYHAKDAPTDEQTAAARAKAEHERRLRDDADYRAAEARNRAAREQAKQPLFARSSR